MGVTPVIAEPFFVVGQREVAPESPVAEIFFFAVCRYERLMQEGGLELLEEPVVVVRVEVHEIWIAAVGIDVVAYRLDELRRVRVDPLRILEFTGRVASEVTDGGEGESGPGKCGSGHRCKTARHHPIADLIFVRRSGT